MIEIRVVCPPINAWILPSLSKAREGKPSITESNYQARVKVDGPKNQGPRTRLANVLKFGGGNVQGPDGGKRAARRRRWSDCKRMISP